MLHGLLLMSEVDEKQPSVASNRLDSLRSQTHDQHGRASLTLINLKFHSSFRLLSAPHVRLLACALELSRSILRTEFLPPECPKMVLVACLGDLLSFLWGQLECADSKIVRHSNLFATCGDGDNTLVDAPS